jgi:hypothetical protein
MARERLRTIFADQGWTVEDLREDYGEDLLVRIFASAKATEYSFYVQLKATEHIDRYLTKQAAYIFYPISTPHLEHWSRFWEPVLLILWDAKGQRFYWECIQTSIEATGLPQTQKQKTFSITIPTTNTLNEEGIRRIVARTKKRFKRFAREKEGANQLLELLRSKLNLESTYEPQAGFLLIPEGRFIFKKNGGSTMYVFRKLAEEFAILAVRVGINSRRVWQKGPRTWGGVDATSFSRYPPGSTEIISTPGFEVLCACNRVQGPSISRF